MLTTLDELREQAARPRTRTVTIPNLGRFSIRTITGRTRLELADELDEKDSQQMLAKLLQVALVDDRGDPLVDEETVQILLEQDGEALQKLGDEIQAFLGLASDSVEAAKKNC